MTCFLKVERKWFTKSSKHYFFYVEYGRREDASAIHPYPMEVPKGKNVP
jgi:hypothetical protein